jgi:endoglucanase
MRNESFFSLPTPSGQEQLFSKKACAFFKENGFDATIDPLGNVIARREKSGAPTVLLCASCDEYGVTIHEIADNGTLHFASLGNYDLAKFAYQAVTFTCGVNGILYPKGDKLKEDMRACDFCIDIGAKTKADAQKRIKIGDCGAFSTSSYPTLSRRACTGQSKMACRLLCELAQEIDSSYSLVIALTVQGNLNARGARVSAFASNADIILEVTETPTANTIKGGRGAVIRHRDKNAICDVTLVSHLRALARQNKIDYQEEAQSEVAGALSVLQSATSARCAAIALPVCHLNTPAPIIEKRDCDAVKALLASFVPTKSNL